jgi:hypothetical protein
MIHVIRACIIPIVVVINVGTVGEWIMIHWWWAITSNPILGAWISLGFQSTLGGWVLGGTVGEWIGSHSRCLDLSWIPEHPGWNSG